MKLLVNSCLPVLRHSYRFLDNNENPEAPLPRETIPLEQDLEQLETQLREVNANQEQLNKNFLELTEVLHSTDQSISLIGIVPIEILPGKRHITYVGFDCVSFLGRISNGTPGC